MMRCSSRNYVYLPSPPCLSLMQSALESLLSRITGARRVRLIVHEDVDVHAPPPLRFPAAKWNAATGELVVVWALLEYAIWKRSWAHIVADALHAVTGSAVVPSAMRSELLAAQRHCVMRPRLLEEDTFTKIVQRELKEEAGMVVCWEPLSTAFPLEKHALQAFTFAPLARDEQRIWWPEPVTALDTPLLLRLEEDVAYWVDKLNMYE